MSKLLSSLDHRIHNLPKGFRAASEPTTGEDQTSRFKSGEIYVNYEEGLRNRHVYLVQSFSHPINEHFPQLLVMIDAAKRASAKTINVVVPYFGYARQERKEQSARTDLG